MPTGKGSHFSLDIGGGVPDVVVVDPFLRSVSAANEAEEVDATVVTSEKREFEPTYERDRLTLRLKATTTSLEFARDAKGLIDADYIYGPFGSAIGQPKISGLCNVLRAQSIPNAEPGTLSELEVELNINTEVHDVFAAAVRSDSDEPEDPEGYERDRAAQRPTRPAQRPARPAQPRRR